ncbi:MAG: tail fiber domain-containing protein, partial [Candidatus Marinimicrobia bacterium]|nr:tail fiber domain-containing protein [Candidatus Neomarinimicrobiota bacterium]
FEVKDKDNNPVFSVYPDYVQVTVPDDGVKAGKHGAFIVTGRSAKNSKATTDITRLTKYNYLIGHNVAPGITGYRNTIFGYEAGNGLTNAANNVIIGYGAGRNLTTESANVLIGTSAGSNSGNYNVLIGQNAGQNAGSSNVMIGLYAGLLSQGGSNNVYIGQNAGRNETGSSLLYIENTSTDDPLIYGDFFHNYLVINGNSTDRTGALANAELIVVGQAGGNGAWINISDKKFKTNIKRINNPLKKTLQLKGVYFNWKDPEKYEPGRQIGFIAQDVNKVLPEVVRTDGKNYGIQYASVTALLVEAIKEQQKEIKERNVKIIELEKRIKIIEKYIDKEK